ncbi:efflux transporter outer membrane subunit [Pluralibacter gergoviae]|uniref:efflux transporter outer membrane subunit n=1 Tax=Pluralibacter gergoviae TaxID=61647 RepID=UPI0008DBF250|nr:efflux transporter outer membrane subunit [Pluralibacter gergoviae]EKW6617335.1 efflux transporter outer membrane subunit [Pluralibacter gergoviae]OHY62696.1 RND transporter [Pluralibacter gergoviae]
MNKPSKKLVAVLITGILTGCSLIPDYQRPEMPVAHQWNPSAAIGESGINQVTWQQFYRQPAMRQVISLALDNNRDLRVAALRVQEAQQRFRISRSALAPTVSAGASETAERTPGDLYNTKDRGSETWHQYEAGVGITSWELDFFGRIRSMNENAMEQFLSMAATEKATQISLISEVASSYLSLAANRDLLQIARQTAESQQNSLTLIQRRYQIGTASDQELAQAEMSLRNAQADMEKYSRQMQENQNALTLLAGTKIPDSLIAKATLNDDYNFPQLKAGVPSSLLTQRPDIIAAEHSLKAANANIGAARAAFFPSISLTTNAGSASDDLGHLFGNGSGAWSFTPSINLPLFTGGRNTANLKLAELQKKEEVATYEKSIQTAFKEVADGLAGRETWRNQVTAIGQENDSSHRYYSLAQARYQAGIDGYLNVLVAQRSDYQAQKDLVNARLGQLSQDVTLYKVLGGGWK